MEGFGAGEGWSGSGRGVEGPWCGMMWCGVVWCSPSRTHPGGCGGGAGYGGGGVVARTPVSVSPDRGADASRGDARWGPCAGDGGDDGLHGGGRRATYACLNANDVALSQVGRVGVVVAHARIAVEQVPGTVVPVAVVLVRV